MKLSKYNKIISDTSLEEKKKVSDFLDKLERQQYEEICNKIWGCVPIDVTWAKSTKLYKDAELEMS